MASFAKLNSENKVIAVESIVNDIIKDSNGIEQEAIGIEFLKNLYNEPNSVWKQASYNTKSGVHLLGGTPFRKNYPGINYVYDEQRNAFIPPKPYNSWILNEETCSWEAPIARSNNSYNWNEETLSWNEVFK